MKKINMENHKIISLQKNPFPTTKEKLTSLIQHYTTLAKPTSSHYATIVDPITRTPLLHQIVGHPGYLSKIDPPTLTEIIVCSTQEDLKAAWLRLINEKAYSKQTITQVKIFITTTHTHFKATFKDLISTSILAPHKMSFHRAQSAQLFDTIIETLISKNDAENLTLFAKTIIQSTKELWALQNKNRLIGLLTKYSDLLTIIDKIFTATQNTLHLSLLKLVFELAKDQHTKTFFSFTNIPRYFSVNSDIPAEKKKNRSIAFYETALLWHCRSGSLAPCKSAIEHLKQADKLSEIKYDLNTITDNEENTPLHIAATQGFDKILDLLLSNGLDPFKLNKDQNTAFHITIARNYQESLKIIVDHSTPDQWTPALFQRNKDKQTPIDLLTKWDIDSLKSAWTTLVHRSRQRNQIIAPDTTALISASQSAGGLAKLEFLISEGLNILKASNPQKGPNHGDTLLQTLLKKNIDRLKDALLAPPLCHISVQQRVTLFRATNAQEENLITLLLLNHHINYLRAFINKWPELKEILYTPSDETRNYPLHLIAKARSHDDFIGVYSIWQEGLDPTERITQIDVPNNHDQTPLEIAIIADNEGNIRELLKGGANPFLVQKQHPNTASRKEEPLIQKLIREKKNETLTLLFKYALHHIPLHQLRSATTLSLITRLNGSFSCNIPDCFYTILSTEHQTLTSKYMSMSPMDQNKTPTQIKKTPATTSCIIS